MYKITFIVVAIFVFAFQGANSALVESQDGGSVVAGESKSYAMANDGGATETTPTTTSPVPSTTPKATGGASGMEICTLLLQVSSLAMVVKHVMQ